MKRQNERPDPSYVDQATDYVDRAGNPLYINNGKMYSLEGGQRAYVPVNERVVSLEVGRVVPDKQLSSVQRIEANEINLRYDSPAFKAEGWEPPFVQDSTIRRVTTAEGAEIQFKRVHVDADDSVGRFLVRESEIAHLGNDAEKIRVYLGLKDKPNYISDVYIPGNIDLNVGRIGAQPNFGLNSTSGFQYQIDQAHKLNPAWFTRNPPEALK